MKSVLLLGALSDIGQSLAVHYAQSGWKVWLAARSSERMEGVQNDIEIRTGKRPEAFIFDALAFETHQEFYNRLPGKPDLAILIFGLLGDQESDMKSQAESLKILHTNYTGAVSIMNIIANDLAEQGEGTLVGISSVAGDRGRKSNYLYGSAKAGFTAYLSGLRNDMFHKGVHVLTVKPGFVNTSMTAHLDLPGPLTAQPDEVAKAIAKGVEKKKNVIYVKWMWRYIMVIIVLIPEFIFKKLKM